MKKIIENKWHLHSITFILCILGLYLTDKYPSFLTIGETGNFLQGFLCVFCSAFLAFLVEWIQGKFFGANKTYADTKQSNIDMLVSVVAGTLGMIVYFLFN